jgi:2-polyprenyl-3-methyl-5-hydroxy-6-metoxy-1,4-benzoquinol methylase
MKGALKLDKAMLTTAKCLLCGSTGLTYVNGVRDSDEHLIGKCETCGHVQLAPLPTAEQDERFYQAANTNNLFKDDADWQNLEWLAERYRPYAENQAENLMRYADKNEKIIEIGSGYGHLVEILRKNGYTIDGIEISADKRRLFKKRTGGELSAINFLEEHVCEGGHDLLCMLQTLEHISAPAAFITHASAMLRKGGRIFIEVPNENDFLKNECVEYRNFTYCRAHLSYFTAETLTMLLEKCGFSNIQIHGYQIFSVENAIWWLRNGEPFKDYHQINAPAPLAFIDEIYKKQLQDKLTSNALIATAIKQ